MNSDRASRYAFKLVAALGACLSQTAVGQCPTLLPAKTLMAASSAIPAGGDSDNRTIVMDLQLNKSGKVSAVQVLSGVEALRRQAIRAAVARDYRSWLGYSWIRVEVKFTLSKHKAPEVREIHMGGSLGCVYGSTPVFVVLPALSSQPAWLDQVMSGQPIVPLLAPAALMKR
jgi:hypothetical protein